jgi:hypothetical protein
MSTTDGDDEAKATNVVQFIRFKVPDELRAFHDAFLAQAISDEVAYGVPNVIKPAMDARAKAAVKLIHAVITTTGWPDRPEANDAYL